MTRLMLDNRNLPAAAETARQMLSAWEGCNETEIKIDAALAAAESGGANRRAAVASLGEGWIGEEALAIGLYSATVGGSFPEVFLDCCQSRRRQRLYRFNSRSALWYQQRPFGHAESMGPEAGCSEYPAGTSKRNVWLKR